MSGSVTHSVLLRNATEIATALEGFDPAKETALHDLVVPSPFGSELARQESFVAKLYLLIFWIGETFFSQKEWQQKKLVETVQKTADCFAKYLTEIRQDIEEMQEKINRAKEQEKISFAEWRTCAEKLLSAQRAMKPLMNTVFSETDEAIKSLANILRSEETIKRVRKLNKSTYFARFITETALAPPIFFLEQLANQGKASQISDEDLAWAKRLHEVDAHNFSYVVMQAFRFLEKSTRTPEMKDRFLPYVGNLILSLDRNEPPSIFKKRDETQESIIEHLKNDENRQEYAQGILDKKRYDNGHIIAFNLGEKEDKLAIFYPSVFETMKNGSLLKNSPCYAVPHIEVRGVHPEGLWLETAQVDYCIDSIEWNVEELYRENSDQQKIALALANLVLFLMQHGSPVDLKPSHLWMEKTKGLFTIVPLKPAEKLNLPLLERFCWEVAKENIEVFRFLVKVTQMQKHVHAKFFSKIVSKFEGNANFSEVFQTLTIPSDMDREMVKKQGEILWENLKSTANALKRSSSKAPLHPRGSISTEDLARSSKRIQKSVQQNIQTVYENVGCIVLLPPNIPENMKPIQIDPYVTKLKSYEQSSK